MHHKFEVVLLLNSQCESGQRDECIACTAFEPRVSGEQESLVVGQSLVELVCCIHEAVEEVVARIAFLNFLFKQFL